MFEYNTREVYPGQGESQSPFRKDGNYPDHPGHSNINFWERLQHPETLNKN